MYLIMPRPKCYFHKNPDKLINKKKKQEVQELIDKIEVLGFIKIGIKIEKAPLWGKAVQEVALASKKDKVFASVFVRRGKVFCYYYTPFVDGQAVLTANGAFPAITSDELLLSAIASAKPEDLLAMHHKQVEAFYGKGFSPYQDYTQDSRVKATYQYYNTKPIRKYMRLAGLVSLLVFIFGCYPFINLIIGSFTES